jgi:RNA polymerase sigma-70 factor, ECF subfamily
MQWLCDCYLPSLWRFVYTRVGGDAHLAEDITSETMLAMLTSIQSSDCELEANAGAVEIQNVGGWLRTVAQRRVADHFRAVSRVQHLMNRTGRGSAHCQPDAAAQQELEEIRAAVRRAMDGLSDQHRLALEWKYLDNLSVREMSQRWDITEKAAESVLFRARRELRERLEQQSEPEPSPNGKPAPRKASPQSESPRADLSHVAPESESEKVAHKISKE